MYKIKKSEHGKGGFIYWLGRRSLLLGLFDQLLRVLLQIVLGLLQLGLQLFQVLQVALMSPCGFLGGLLLAKPSKSFIRAIDISILYDM